jgi:hypothetical protein
VEALLDATGEVIAVIDLYRDVAAVDEFRTITDRETAVTADWEKAAGTLAVAGAPEPA